MYEDLIAMGSLPGFPAERIWEITFDGNCDWLSDTEDLLMIIRLMDAIAFERNEPELPVHVLEDVGTPAAASSIVRIDLITRKLRVRMIWSKTLLLNLDLHR
jgi:hypothetical protein